MRMKIAVIGSGVSGLGASLILSQKHEVHLFESEKRLGGHAHTSQVKIGEDLVDLDTGFLVYNDLTYPHLRSMFKHLNVETVNSDMSLAIRVPHLDLEWAGDNLDTVFAQRKNLLRPRFHKLLIDILKFHKHAESNRELSRQNRWTVRQLLKEQGFSSELAEWYVLPMVAAIWSTPETKMLDFPAETFLTFFLNHKLLQVNDRPQWKTVKNGSKNYVQKIAEKLQNIHLDEPITSVQKSGNHVKVVSSNQEYLFDKVIFATQPSLTRKILKTEHSEVTRVLNSFNTVTNTAYLHQDESLMPKSKKCWASWCVQANYNTQHEQQVSLTYYLNRLQPLKTQQNLFLTLNPTHEPKNTLLKVKYGHPLFDQAAIDAQAELPSVQGFDGVYFIGAWTRYGFHEDGLLSAVKLARLFDINTPWTVD